MKHINSITNKNLFIFIETYLDQIALNNNNAMKDQQQLKFDESQIFN